VGVLHLKVSLIYLFLYCISFYFSDLLMESFSPRAAQQSFEKWCLPNILHALRNEMENLVPIAIIPLQVCIITADKCIYYSDNYCTTFPIKLTLFAAVFSLCVIVLVCIFPFVLFFCSATPQRQIPRAGRHRRVRFLGLGDTAETDS
jgi:hypothetical protein